MTVCTNQAVNVVKRKRAKVQDDDLPPPVPCMDAVECVHYECGHAACAVLVDHKACPACVREEQECRTALQRPTMSTTLT